MSTWKTTVVKVPIGHFTVLDPNSPRRDTLSIRMDMIESYQGMGENKVAVQMASGRTHYLDISHAKFKEHYNTAMRADLS